MEVVFREHGQSYIIHKYAQRKPTPGDTQDSHGPPQWERVGVKRESAVVIESREGLISAQVGGSVRGGQGSQRMVPYRLLGSAILSCCSIRRANSAV